MAPSPSGSPIPVLMLDLCTDNNMTTILTTNSNSIDHDPENHPESAWRHQAILRARQRVNVAVAQLDFDETMIDWAVVESVHSRSYLSSVKSGQIASCFDADTKMGVNSHRAIAGAAAAAIALVDMIVGGECENGLAAIRPPGHHAAQESGSGYCFLNNAAIAVRRAQTLGCERILVIDLDVHHGDGTQSIFYEDPSVFYYSIHECDLYPAQSGPVRDLGTGRGTGYTMNMPLPTESTDADYAFALQKGLSKIAKEFKPDLVVVSLGFDAHADDPMSSMLVSTTGFVILLQLITDFAARYACGRVACILEGGYNTTALEECIVQCVSALLAPGASAVCGTPRTSVVAMVESAVGGLDAASGR